MKFVIYYEKQGLCVSKTNWCDQQTWWDLTRQKQTEDH